MIAGFPGPYASFCCAYIGTFLGNLSGRRNSRNRIRPLGLEKTSFAARGRARSRPAKNSFIIGSISLDTSRVYSISPQVSRVSANSNLTPHANPILIHS
ncbi:hypothetical protein, partial [Methanothrix sp.]|uniref:hypothetical protein n=1 Tax=Methanothrix sp. TaxID=90426 RepID=UPI0032987BD7